MNNNNQLPLNYKTEQNFSKTYMDISEKIEDGLPTILENSTAEIPESYQVLEKKQMKKSHIKKFSEVP